MRNISCSNDLIHSRRLPTRDKICTHEYLTGSGAFRKCSNLFSFISATKAIDPINQSLVSYINQYIHVLLIINSFMLNFFLRKKEKFLFTFNDQI